MRSPSEQIRDIRSTLPDDVVLVAVSKYHSQEAILVAYEGGQRVFGESHVQELEVKQQHLPKDIEWHFIGHLQTNKVKYIVPYISLIHAVDSPRLLKEIEKQAARCGQTVSCLLQLHIAQEETKFGFTPEECLLYLSEGEWRQMKHVRIRGIMCMASNVEDVNQIEREFQLAAELFDKIKSTFFSDDDKFSIRSWGMSDDYPIAIKNSSNMIRVGSKIFGSRTY